MALDVFTVGHSRHPWPAFVRLLEAAHIDLVADVRSLPRSRFCPHFNRHELAAALNDADIGYEWLGYELGGRPQEPEFYDAQGKVQYDRIAATPRFRRGLERVKELARGSRVALLCSEEDPSACHRTLLVGCTLATEGVTLRHLRGDGRVHTDGDLGQSAPDLFGG